MEADGIQQENYHYQLHTSTRIRTGVMHWGNAGQTSVCPDDLRLPFEGELRWESGHGVQPGKPIKAFEKLLIT